eukprot:12409054-Heterocapsa_arctica.AAC.1
MNTLVSSPGDPGTLRFTPSHAPPSVWVSHASQAARILRLAPTVQGRHAPGQGPPAKPVPVPRAFLHQL